MADDLFRDESLFDNSFENFTHSVGAVRLLLKKAHQEGNLIEGLILYAAVIDALLRNLLALETGIRREDGSISLADRFFNHDETLWFNERKIYRMAFENNIINRNIFDKLNSLYSFRNQIVHRFIISQVAYNDISSRLIEYELIYQDLFRKLEKWEQPTKPLSKRDQIRVRVNILKKINRKMKP